MQSADVAARSNFFSLDLTALQQTRALAALRCLLQDGDSGFIYRREKLSEFPPGLTLNCVAWRRCTPVATIVKRFLWAPPLWGFVLFANHAGARKTAIDWGGREPPSSTSAVRFRNVLRVKSHTQQQHVIKAGIFLGWTKSEGIYCTAPLWGAEASIRPQQRDVTIAAFPLHLKLRNSKNW